MSCACVCWWPRIAVGLINPPLQQPPFQLLSALQRLLAKPCSSVTGTPPPWFIHHFTLLHMHETNEQVHQTVDGGTLGVWDSQPSALLDKLWNCGSERFVFVASCCLDLAAGCCQFTEIFHLHCVPGDFTKAQTAHWACLYYFSCEIFTCFPACLFSLMMPNNVFSNFCKHP